MPVKFYVALKPPIYSPLHASTSIKIVERINALASNDRAHARRTWV